MRLNNELFTSLNSFQKVVNKAVDLFYITIRIDIIFSPIIPRLLTIDNIKFATPSPLYTFPRLSFGRIMEHYSFGDKRFDNNIAAMQLSSI